MRRFARLGFGGWKHAAPGRVQTSRWLAARTATFDHLALTLGK